MEALEKLFVHLFQEQQMLDIQAVEQQFSNKHGTNMRTSYSCRVLDCTDHLCNSLAAGSTAPWLRKSSGTCGTTPALISSSLSSGFSPSASDVVSSTSASPFDCLDWRQQSQLLQALLVSGR
ncbi:hypothetical protein T4B_868 [Trichinella pseudospiralis]|uniref:Uncharacterized protein n=1 Tax=Trichinella pseudospiralis TaxID=6337 RepID=A0A0V1IVT1_TRIPS|nr:hypothetical protein T4A_4790 [Trichinella pseudospiralis]KRZ26716.1 hypothetical protein T4B_868 [Trichinella pseudospiralis]KRZ44687.1 hypothetical protein T4C_1456 [Trichinella pseudospiralis]